MSQRQVWRILVLCLLLIGLAQSSRPLLIAGETEKVFAQSDGEEPNPVVQSYAEAMGISYEEAERRLAIQLEMDVLGRKIAGGEPTYAGSWILHQPEFGLIVSFAAPNGAEIIQPYLEGIAWADLVQVQQAPYSVDELLAIQTQVSEAARSTGIPFGAGSNIPLSRVNLYTLQPEELRRQLETKEEIQVYLDMIDYIEEGPAAPASSLYEIYLPRIVVGGEE